MVKHNKVQTDDMSKYSQPISDLLKQDDNRPHDKLKYHIEYETIDVVVLLAVQNNLVSNSLCVCGAFDNILFIFQNPLKSTEI